MTNYTSKTIEENGIVYNTNNEVTLSFSITKGTEVINITDKLLTNFDIAEARAKAEFLEQSYIAKRISISTYHLDGLQLNHIIQVDGIVYKVMRISDKVKKAKVIMKIIAERWE